MLNNHTLVTGMIIGLIAFPTFTFAESSASIIGSHFLKRASSVNTAEITLTCKNENSCNITYQTSENLSEKEIQSYNHVKKLDDLQYAQNALNYAVVHKEYINSKEDTIQSNQKLSPILDNNPKVTKCWDLDAKHPGYVLACTLKVNSDNAYPLYLFSSLMASCGQDFCRYIINPMSPINAE